jgi:endonuclease/exonuclease/phosphatase family metal-dependent hydrolase
VLSRLAFDRVVSHKADEFTEGGTASPVYHYSRDCLELHLTVNGRRVILLGVHFKAKAPPDDPQKRLAEGEHTRAIADALTAADPEAAVLVLGDFNDTPDSPAVAAIAGAAPSVYVDSAARVSPAEDAWSYEFQGTRQLIDHQLASPKLAALLVPGSVTITHAAAQSAASDHAPVAATYRIE